MPGKLSKPVLAVAWLRLGLLPCFQHDPHFSCWVLVFLMEHHTQPTLPWDIAVFLEHRTSVLAFLKCLSPVPWWPGLQWGQGSFLQALRALKVSYTSVKFCHPAGWPTHSTFYLQRAVGLKCFPFLGVKRKLKVPKSFWNSTMQRLP